MSTLKIFSGRSNKPLVDEICKNLGLSPGIMNIKQFADGELFIEIGENVRGVDVFLVQPTSKPANDHLMELLLMIDACKRASAKQIVATMPYYGYARQDRKDRPRVALSAKLVANQIVYAGADRILAMDLHSAPIGGFFDIPVDHLYALPVFVEYMNKLIETGTVNKELLTVVSPDVGGVSRARGLAQALNVPLAIVDKYREGPNVSEVMNVIGDVKDRDCLMVDDMIDTSGTICKGAASLVLRGAKSVRAMTTHGVLSYDHKEDISAIDKLERSSLTEVIVTNTIRQTANQELILRNDPNDDSLRVSSKLKVLSVAGLFAKAIDAIHGDTSVSGLFV